MQQEQDIMEVSVPVTEVVNFPLLQLPDVVNVHHACLIKKNDEALLYSFPATWVNYGSSGS
jgi:hypothetical protein